jgi:probable F420-dependent oxidoreductase
MESRRAFRFGVVCAQRHSRHDWREKARKAEQLGYATFLVPDHLQGQLAPVPALLAAADATTTLRIGSHVFANDFRHPVMLAKEAATLDLLSDGRFELGLGAGWMRAEYDQAGLEFAPPGVRVGRLEEAVRLLQAALERGAHDVCWHVLHGDRFAWAAQACPAAASSDPHGGWRSATAGAGSAGG